MKNSSVKIAVQTALFVALALVVRRFSSLIAVGGVGSIRIGFSEIFTKMPAFLFGPIYGGIASGLVDALAQVIMPEGPFLWLMFPVMIAGGALTGLFWNYFKKKSSKKLQTGFIVFCLFFLFFGIFNHYTLTADTKSPWYDILLRLKENLPFATYGLYAAAVLGIIFLVIDIVLKKKYPGKYNDDFLQLVATIFLSDIIVTTLNTFVFRFYFDGLAKLPFWMFYASRLIPDFVQTAIFAYIISFLLKIHRKITK